MSSELVNIKGQLERITYYNEENDYAVLKVKVYGYTDLVTVVGNVVSPTPGEVLTMSGEWINHPQFGEQFKVVFGEKNSTRGIFTLLIKTAISACKKKNS